jgi:uncharacterized membrane protein YphA (DoxX/SURF4 family)
MEWTSMSTEPKEQSFPRALLLWALRIVLAALLAIAGSIGTCQFAGITGLFSTDYVCGHNVGLTVVPLFFFAWALVELVLPAFLSRLKK